MFNRFSRFSGVRTLLFKNWSRKGFGVFNSLHATVKITVVCATYSLLMQPQIAIAQMDSIEVAKRIDIEELVVSAARTPEIYAQTARAVTVITREEIAGAPVHSLQDLLEYARGVDVRQRGGLGVQADVSIRGGSFDQTLVLLNGINITDPQTGHHNLALPLDLESVERIEILEGPGARVFGPNAFSGAINIITGTKDKNHLRATLMEGEHGLHKSTLSGTFAQAKHTHFVSVTRSKSDGYIDNTDFEQSSAFIHNVIRTKPVTLDIQSGFTRKEFGANSFYTPRFPAQYETNDVYFASIKGTAGKEISITPTVYYRRVNDHYILIKDNPAFYQNFHSTDVAGAGINLTKLTLLGKTSLGIDYRLEHIYSTNLGNTMNTPRPVKWKDGQNFTKSDRRLNQNYFIEHIYRFNRLYLSGGALIYHSNALDKIFRIYPGIDAGIDLTPAIKWYSSVNKSLRLPTFTDLYYQGPSNVGNPDLRPEEALTYETGIKYVRGGWNGSLSLYHREGKNIIDWVWIDDVEKWHTMNYTELTTNGLDVSMHYRFGGENHTPFSFRTAGISFSWIDVDKDAGEFKSNYVLDHLKSKLTFFAEQNLYGGFGLSYRVGYQDRAGSYGKYFPVENIMVETAYEPFMLVDARVWWKRKTVSLYLEASNLLDTPYHDLGNIVQPGRWVKAGATIDLYL